MTRRKPFRLLAVLSFAIALLLLPQAAFADDGSDAPSMTFHTISAIKTGDTVHFGPYSWDNNMNEWYVLNGKRSSTNLRDGKFCINTGIIPYVNFSNGKSDSKLNDYSTSRLKEYADNYIKHNFNQIQQGALQKTTTSESRYTIAPEDLSFFDHDKLLDGDLIFPLSAEEWASNNVPEATGYYSSHWWWLRSAIDETDNIVGVVGPSFDEDGDRVSSELAYRPRLATQSGFRPAMNISPGGIYFATDADYNRAEEAPMGAISPVPCGRSGVWDLTLLDRGLDCNASLDWNDGEKMQISFNGARSGDNDYMSLFVFDKNDDFVYYGLIAAATEEGTYCFDIPDGINDSDTVVIMAEEINEDNDDYAFPVASSKMAPTVTYVHFDPSGGTAVDDQRVELGKAAVKPAAPKKDGYTFKGWEFNGEPYDFTEEVNEEITLTAKWERTIKGELLPTLRSSGSRKLSLTWPKMQGPDGYEVWLAPCKKNSTCKKVADIPSSGKMSYTKGKLKKGCAYRAYVRAYIYDEETLAKRYVKKSYVVHAIAGGYNKTYANAKTLTLKQTSMTLKVNKTAWIKAKKITTVSKKKKLLSKGHSAKLRYLSTNKKIASVSKSGVIKGIAKGKCKIYAYTPNGIRKAVSVTVK